MTKQLQLAFAMVFLAGAALAAGFEENLELQGITFRVTLSLIHI